MLHRSRMHCNSMALHPYLFRTHPTAEGRQLPNHRRENPRARVKHPTPLPPSVSRLSSHRSNRECLSTAPSRFSDATTLRYLKCPEQSFRIHLNLPDRRSRGRTRPLEQSLPEEQPRIYARPSRRFISEPTDPPDAATPLTYGILLASDKPWNICIVSTMEHRSKPSCPASIGAAKKTVRDRNPKTLYMSTIQCIMPIHITTFIHPRQPHLPKPVRPKRRGLLQSEPPRPLIAPLFPSTPTLLQQNL